jgi:hypothetical protein
MYPNISAPESLTSGVDSKISGPEIYRRRSKFQKNWNEIFESEEGIPKYHAKPIILLNYFFNSGTTSRANSTTESDR